MTYKQRRDMEFERDYYKLEAQIAKMRLEQERKEYHDRLKDRIFFLALIIVTGLTIIMCNMALHETLLWASGR